jgi:hypothetical protein
VVTKGGDQAVISNGVGRAKSSTSPVGDQLGSAHDTLLVSMSKSKAHDSITVARCQGLDEDPSHLSLAMVNLVVNRVIECCK